MLQVESAQKQADSRFARQSADEDMSPKVTRMHVIENPTSNRNKNKGNHVTSETGTQKDFDTIVSDHHAVDALVQQSIDHYYSQQH